jgi:hypothetical protein
MITIYLRPQDGAFIMGEDYPLTVAYDTSIMNVKKMVERLKGIHHERSVIFNPRGNKPIDKTKESWYVP